MGTKQLSFSARTGNDWGLEWQGVKNKLNLRLHSVCRVASRCNTRKICEEIICSFVLSEYNKLCIAGRVYKSANWLAYCTWRLRSLSHTSGYELVNHLRMELHIQSVFSAHEWGNWHLTYSRFRKYFTCLFSFCYFRLLEWNVKILQWLTLNGYIYFSEEVIGKSVKTSWTHWNSPFHVLRTHHTVTLCLKRSMVSYRQTSELPPFLSWTCFLVRCSQ